MTVDWGLEHQEGWALVDGHYVPGVAGSASGKSHFFRAGRSLCGTSTTEAVSMPSLGLRDKAATDPCKTCTRIHKREHQTT